MRVVPLLVTTTLLFAAPVFAQQASSTNSTPAQSTSTAARPPEHPITPEQFREMLKLTGADKFQAQFAHTVWISVQKTLPPYTPKDVMDELESGFVGMDLDSMELRIYQKYLSTEDAAQIISFDKTPAGQRMIKVMPLITTEVYLGGERLGEQLFRRVANEHAAEIKAAAAKYQSEHTGAPTITTTN